MIVRICVTLWFICLSLPALAQGFAGLGTEAEGFAVPDPAEPLTFPRDHFPHPDYRIEWWYVTATLKGADGQDYGIQWTLFRSALQPVAAEGWSASQLWMGHAGLTTPERHFVAERRGRGGLGVAGVSAGPFHAFIDDWSFLSTSGEDAPYQSASLTASFADARYDLELRADGPLVLHGTTGYSQKSAKGQASYYYSQPFYKVTGTLELPEGPVAVTGDAWLDREWSSQPLASDQTGWDWFSLKFEDGSRMMAFALRSETGAPYTSVTWISPEGIATPYGDGALVATPLDTSTVAGRQVPTEWRLQLADKGLDITTRPLNPQSWMATSFPYWEGPISFEGSHRGKGYLEMTGYK